MLANPLGQSSDGQCDRFFVVQMSRSNFLAKLRQRRASRFHHRRLSFTLDQRQNLRVAQKIVHRWQQAVKIGLTVGLHVFFFLTSRSEAREPYSYKSLQARQINSPLYYSRLFPGFLSRRFFTNGRAPSLTLGISEKITPPPPAHTFSASGFSNAPSPAPGPLP